MKKLTCKQVRRIIDTSSPAQWPAELREAIEAHLARCSVCRREFEATRLISAAVASGKRLRVSADFSAQLMARIAARQPRQAPQRRRAWPRWQPVLAAAAAVALIVIAVALVSLHGWPVASPGGTQTATSTRLAAADDAAFVRELVMYHQHLAMAELGGDAGLLLAANGFEAR